MKGRGWCFFAAALASGLAGPVNADALDEALERARLARADLGFEARGYWERYPADIPYKLRHFDDLVAQPLAIPPFARAMGATLRIALAPEMLAGKTNGTGGGALFVAAHDLAVNKKNGASRAYSANLKNPETPLADALLEAWPAGHRAVRQSTFGKPPEVTVEARVRAACAGVPPGIGRVVGRLFLDLLDTRRGVELAFRNVPRETRERIAARLDLGEEQSDALEYEPAMDDAARLWDEVSLWNAGLRAVAALDQARLALSDSLLAASGDLAGLRLEIATPVGRVLVTGTGNDVIEAGEDLILALDLGGNDRYEGALAGSSPDRPVGAALDLGGDDEYSAGDAALGAGLVGVGVLVDAGGRDHYSGRNLGQGAAQFGFGALIDLAGDDRFEQSYAGQGAGYFGVGLLIDVAGDDTYTLWVDGQGFGGVAGVGVLADREGDDQYVAVSDPAVTGRPSGHSDNKISVSDAQGCGMGRRGDGSDGHSWSGGLGALLDAEGNDSYAAGNWAQACGYWFGTGLLWDGGGDDTYRATGWAQASGAHFAIGGLVDEAGDDRYTVAQNWGPSFGHDFVASILVDAAGNDDYTCGGEGVGWSINRSVALHLEGSGDDRYTFGTAGKHPGGTNYDPRFLDRGASTVYWTESTSVGLFLDAGGHDVYPEGYGDGVARADDPASDTARARNFGIFVDQEGGAIDLDRPQGRR